MSVPKIGQVWREVDPRFERYVQIKDIEPRFRTPIGVRTVIRKADKWVDAPRSRLAWCDVARFNGKRGGYEFSEDAAP